jgi:hypothetical protein
MVAINYILFYFFCFYVSVYVRKHYHWLCLHGIIPLGKWTINAYSETLGEMKIYNVWR